MNSQPATSATSATSTTVPPGISAWAWEAIGAVPEGPGWAIPERNAAGEIIGTSVRASSGQKFMKPGSRRGLTLKWPVDQYAGASADEPVFVVEGASDAAAGLGLSLDVVGRPSAAGGADYLIELLQDRHVCMVGENDAAGRDGAHRIALKLLPFCLSVKVIFPPGGHKDLRAWVLGGGNRADVLAAAARAEVCKPAQPDTFTVSLADIQTEVVNWLWPGRFPRGKVSMIGGNPDVGKTYVTADIAARVTTGEPWPDAPTERRPPAGVVFINGEDGLADTIKPRLMASGASLERVRAVPLLGEKGATGRRWFTLSDIPSLEKAIAETPDCAVVIIDPVSAFLGNCDENTNGDVRGLMGPLADLASRYNVAIILITHPSKASGVRAIHRLLGSVGWVGAARSVWCVVPEHGNEDRRLLLKVKNNLSKHTPGLAYSIGGEPPRVIWESGTVEMTADEALTAHSAAADERGELDDAVEWLTNLLADGPRPARDVEREAKDAGISLGTLRRAKPKARVVSRKPAFGGPWDWALDEPHDDTKVRNPGAHAQGFAHLGQEIDESTEQSSKMRNSEPLRTLGKTGSRADGGEDAQGGLEPSQGAQSVQIEHVGPNTGEIAPNVPKVRNTPRVSTFEENRFPGEPDWDGPFATKPGGGA